MVVADAQKERVLCSHGPLVYEAEVLDVKRFAKESSLLGRAG
jgi:hypothetical protein